MVGGVVGAGSREMVGRSRIILGCRRDIGKANSNPNNVSYNSNCLQKG